MKLHEYYYYKNDYQEIENNHQYFHYCKLDSSSQLIVQINFL